MAAVSRDRFPWPAKLLTMVIAIALVFGVYRLVLHQRVAHHLQLLAQSLPGCTGMRYSKLSIPYFALQADLQNVALDFANGIPPITADTAHIRRFRPGNRFPRALDAAMRGIVLNAGHPLLPFGNGLRDLGYPVLKGDLHIQWERHGDTPDDWNLNLMLKMAAAGEMVLSLQLAKVNTEGIMLALREPYNWLMVLPAIELIELRCSYVDEGLFERAVYAAALDRGQAPQVFLEALQRQLEALRQREEDFRVRSVWQSLEAFCSRPGRIRLQTNLTHPIPLGQLWWLRRPEEFIRHLALECRVD
jgi:hypothetical protein